MERCDGGCGTRWMDFGGSGGESGVVWMDVDGGGLGRGTKRCLAQGQSISLAS